MDILAMLGHGFAIALTPTNLMMCLAGVVTGTMVGALPGLGDAAAIAILLPFTFGRDPTSSMIMLSGIYYGAMYGGSLTSILINTPGEASSVVTCLDGYQMALKGRAGAALGISAIGSFVAGTVGVVLLMVIAPVLTAFSLSFGPPEFFALMLLGLTAVTAMGGTSLIKNLMAGLFGLMLATVGTDSMTGYARFNYGEPSLLDGIPLVAAFMGLFGVAEVLVNVETRLKVKVIETRWKDLYPNRQELKDSVGPIWRGTLIGFLIGLLPGGGATIATFFSYAIEKGVSKHPEKFGTGAIEGVAGPETANNAASAGAMVPLLALGIPSSGTAAVLLGALMMSGLKPGPMLMQNNPDFFWGLIASMYIGNVLLLIINMPLVPLFAKVLFIPYWLLAPVVILFCFVGTYSLGNSVFDLWLLLFFSILGYLMKKLDFSPATLVLGLVLGGMMESAFKRSLQIGQGDFTILFMRPIAGTLMALTVLVLLARLLRVVLKWLKSPRQAASESA
jgi:putative tricarboxylic transport membrane protein